MINFRIIVAAPTEGLLISAAFRDVTERNRLEERLKQFNRQLEHEVKLKTSALTATSGEINILKPNAYIMEQHEIDILLIEDNHDEAELAIRSLKKNNLANRLKHIDDGAEALEFIFSTGQYAGRTTPFNPKLILLDLKLPKVDGLEILRRLKSSDATYQIPIVVLTSSKEEKDIIESYKLGVNSYIVKPVNFESFTKAISELGLYWLLLNQNPFEKSV